MQSNQLQLNLKDTEGALAAYHQAVEISEKLLKHPDKSNPPLIFTLLTDYAELLIENGQTEATSLIYQRLFTLELQDTDLLLQRIIIAEKSGHLETANKDAQKIVAIVNKEDANTRCSSFL